MAAGRKVLILAQNGEIYTHFTPGVKNVKYSLQQAYVA
jgi:hypothetical protein